MELPYVDESNYHCASKILTLNQNSDNLAVIRKIHFTMDTITPYWRKFNTNYTKTCIIYKRYLEGKFRIYTISSLTIKKGIKWYKNRYKGGMGVHIEHSPLDSCDGITKLLVPSVNLEHVET